MRCIEISIAYVFEAFASEINRNMRCIEIFSVFFALQIDLD